MKKANSGSNLSKVNATRKKISSLKKADSRISNTNKAIKKMTSMAKRVPKPSARKPYGR